MGLEFDMEWVWNVLSQYIDSTSYLNIFEVFYT